ncbi:MAG: mucoidy inhibitor MuiA family protein [Flavobacteriaceae bacterium]|nr:mucoidy inhibitor MuiA family protein [Flavobacteriaceae bacterium]
MNKKLFTLAIMLAFACQLYSQHEKTVKATVKKAVVYLQGAQLYSSETLNLNAGRTDIIFDGVSSVLQESGIQASGKGNFIITETRFIHKFKELTTPKIEGKYVRQIEQVQDSIDDIDYLLMGTRNRNSTLETEKKMLLGNRIITGQSQKDSLPLLRDGMNFLRERLNNIYAEQLKISREERRLNKQKTKLEIRKQELELLLEGRSSEPKSAEAINQVVVTVFADAATQATISITYFVANAGWVPYYELHGEPADGSIKLKHMASIFQKSLVDWKDASITLSTATPNGFSYKPELSNWYVGFYQAQIYKKDKAQKMYSGAPKAAETNGYAMTDDVKAEVAEDMSNFAVATQNMILTEYELKIKYNIPSDDQHHYVSIQTKDLPASYYYSVVPKLDKKAYLMARVTGWEDLNLIPGKAKIFYDGNLAGNTSINPDATTDTLLLNMGRDNSLVIQKRKLKDECSEKVIHDEHVKKLYYEIVVRNTKNIPIYVTIEDQIPLVQVGQTGIKVELKESSNADYSEIDGKLTWNVKIGVKDSKKVTFGFQVTSPRNQIVSGL